jgi:hypothetical protein
VWVLRVSQRQGAGDHHKAIGKADPPIERLHSVQLAQQLGLGKTIGNIGAQKGTHVEAITKVLSTPFHRQQFRSELAEHEELQPVKLAEGASIAQRIDELNAKVFGS